MKLFNVCTMAFVVLILSACRSAISVYDHHAYTQTTAIKVDAIDVMSHGHERFDDYSKEVKMVDLHLRKLIEYERHRPGNQIINSMWQRLQDTSANLYGGFIRRWENKKQLDSNFVADQCRLVGLAFDQIAELQSKLIKRK